MMKTTSLIALLILLLFTISCQRSADFLKGDAVTYRHDLEMGVSANDLLTSTKYKSLVIEIQYLSLDFVPDTRVADHLKTLLGERLNKPEGVSIVTKQIQPSTQIFGIDQIKSIEETSRTEFTKGSCLAVYILYLNGYYAADSLVLGAAYRNTSLAVFGKSISDHAAGDSLNRLLFDATVIEHEFGHLLGLVDQATPAITDHKDLPNGNHCTNRNCLMHYSFLDSHDAQYPNGLASVPVMDSACVADLRANGGR
ncbi:MAG: hypothetical protein JWM28_1416 [Chitinophagaceae bacterium]|nr:hypothetical protein [Chitinophagaceae bacterium]